MQEGELKTIPQLQDQVPLDLQEGQATNQEAQDHLQGIKAQLVYVSLGDHMSDEL